MKIGKKYDTILLGQKVRFTYVIPANEYGTMAHDLLEHLIKSETSKEEFSKQASDRFDEYLVFNPSDNKVLVENCRKDFIKMMQNAYEMEENCKTE